MSVPRSASLRYEIGGYVLAGGRSTRMGRDKALVELAGKPLVAWAVEKLRRLCADASIVGSPALAAFAPVVPDLHPGCGPLGGIEAALAHSTYDWNLFLAVDMPLMPTAILEAEFVRVALSAQPSPVAVIHTVDGRDQPLCAMYHRSLLPFISRFLEAGEYKPMVVVREVAHLMALERKLEATDLLRNRASGSGTIAPDGSRDSDDSHDLERFDEPDDSYPEGGAGVLALTMAQRAARSLWFANVNTPEDLALVAAHADALEDSASGGRI
ncbi:MAG: molybdenum cofactor guanylyltransferase [Acidobacteriaceae bacterium]